MNGASHEIGMPAGTHAEVIPERRSPHAVILANRLPWPLDDGWKVRTFHIVRGVAADARVTLVVFHPGADRETAASAREALGPGVRLITVDPPVSYRPGAVLRGLLTRHPVHIWNQESAELRHRLESLMMTDPPDLFVAESTFVARYLDLVPTSVPRVIDTHNVDSVTFSRYVSALRFGPRRAYATITARKLAAFEKATYRDASGVWVCSDIERDLVRGLAPSTPVWTVPNGVDTGYFQPDDSPPAADRVLFFGRLDYYPNIDGLEFFVRDILPVLKRRRPGIELHIVGSGSTAGIESFVAADPAVRVIGRVADLRGALRSASVVVVPLRVGGGTRLKVLEALSMARPVVSTTIGAEGIDVRSGEHLVLADRADTFATSVADLLDDPAAALAMGRNGRQLVTARYDWSRIGGIVAGCLRELAAPDAE
jgi:sugar transferase (PEP-CTERM/EpsH1 system associated)